MSASDTGEEEIPGREIAYRLFAAEYDDASLSYAESDEERAPNYVISPTGARLNRLFVVGTLTEVTAVNDEMVRARVVDPTGAFVVYAGQYQPDELAALEQLEPPAFVAVTGKARTFQPDDSDQVYTSIRPESIATVDADTRDRWVVSAAEQTLERIGTYAGAAALEGGRDELTDTLREAGVEAGLAAGIPLAQGHYGTTASYLDALRDCAVEAVEVVAGDREQVSGLSLTPDTSSPASESVTFDSLTTVTESEIEAFATGDEADTQPTEAGGAAESSDTAGNDESESVGTAAVAGTATSMEREDTTDETVEATPDAAHDVGSSEEAKTASTNERGIESDSIDSEPEAADETADTSTALDESTDDALETADVDTSTPDDGELGDFDAGDGGMYEMDDEERQELEAEFGAEFTTGTEVDEPGEADIDVQEPDDESAADESSHEHDASTGSEPIESDEDTASDDEVGAPPESGLEDESEPLETADEAEAADDADTASADEPADDIDVQSYVIETMAELDDGDGADRTTLVETVADDTGVAEADIEDAIQDALMGGECYEPDDDRLKAI
ncbi:hypothetical protein [Natronorubrum sulfidifaciens]|uniref:Rpa-associated protein n=1 Tax=Natronorubrum sulfidifaciens JCM 14089 TaxID=1230460 RepID=L9WJ55_9EURY|nr:hypothetical protein [Natronorubrum sulfidifaciens]ELY49479.1 hypothetical protein C495_00900 [Natronorubrum sulfidifaciens JCM 14089]